MTDKPKLSGLALLREPFPAHQISKLPKPTKKQAVDLRDAMDRRDFSLGIRCTICGTYHHKDVIHLDYVGHAALTDRLLDADPNWNWEPVTDNGFPKLDANVGMWIRLTVCGVTRLGYGHAENKKGGDAIKEVIGDALRNAAMRFGAALDLWHKGDLHADDEPDAAPPAPAAAKPYTPGPRQAKPEPAPETTTQEAIARAKTYIANAENLDDVTARWKALPKHVRDNAGVIDAAKAAKAAHTPADPLDEGGIPY